MVRFIELYGYSGHHTMYNANAIYKEQGGFNVFVHWSWSNVSIAKKGFINPTKPESLNWKKRL